MNYRNNSPSHHVSFSLTILGVLMTLAGLPLGVYAATAPGFPISITGSGFTPENNWVQFTNNTTQAIYEAGPMPSNGTTLSFNVPPDAPAGNYTVKAGAFNSDWSNGKAFTISTAIAPVVSLSAPPLTLLSGQSTQINWASAGASNCQGSTVGTTTPLAWATPGLTGTFSFTPDRSTTFSLSCGGQAGTTTKSVTVSVSAQKAPPEVTLTAAPRIIGTLGQGTTLAWTTSNATSCLGSGGGLLSWSWNDARPLNGSLYVVPNQDTTFKLLCTGAGGTASSTLDVTSTIIITTPLNATCSIVPASTVGKNQLATFTIIPTGGAGMYSYSWSGTDGLVGNTQSVSTYYMSSGAKTASATITSWGQSITTQCPTLQADMSLAGPTVPYKYCLLNQLTPYSGPSGTVVRTGPVSGTGCSVGTDGSSAFVIRNGLQKMYIRPNSAMPWSFPITSSPPLPGAPSTYLVSLLNNYTTYGLLSTGELTFNLTAPSVSPPAVTDINPFTGAQGSVVTLTGSGFSADTTVLVSKDSATYAITPSAVTATSLTFSFTIPSSVYGDYLVTASKQGTTSNAIAFTLTPPINPPPTILLSASPTAFTLGAATTISWITTDASICQGSGATSAWNKTQPLIGSLSFNPIQTTTYTLTCSGPGGTSVKTLTLPATLTINTSGLQSSYHVGETVPIKWTSSGINKVQINLIDKGKYTYPAFASVPASNGQYNWVIKSSDIPYINEYYKISLSDSNNPSITSKSSLIEFVPAFPSSVNISISPTSIIIGQSATLSWSSTTAIDCTASGAWTGYSDGGAHSITVTPTLDSTYILTCTGANGASASGSAKIIVYPPETPVGPAPIENTSGTYTINVQVFGMGTVSSANKTCPTQCSQSGIPSGTRITLYATPSSGSTFAGWSGGGCSGTALSCTVTITSNTTVTATFMIPSTSLQFTPPNFASVISAFIQRLFK